MAFTSANAEALLDKAARQYVNHRRGAHIKDGRLMVSKIYGWYDEDFGGGEDGVLRHLRRYAAPELARALTGIRSIDGYEYDWGLNESAS